MSENQTKESPSDTLLTPVFHTILAAENKSSELFVKSFHYQGENIATKHLGQIFGFFEIPDTQEDNAYIVNFLASVVKKEYFVNPKRSASDSFEAALHKINLALTELVKQGNTGWLGKLNGVVSVIEGTAFHFSVTGDASILLYRDSQVNVISEGLADKDAALHPLKTFLEISSGALSAQDKVLLTSPELFSLCSPDTLLKNAFRMDTSGFARYVRAALVNELPLGVSIIIDMNQAPVPVKPKKKAATLREESLEKLQNVFSNTPFSADTAPAVTPNENGSDQDSDRLDEETILEYIDQKTGHIYVQGGPDNHQYKEPSSWDHFKEEYLWPLFAAFRLAVKRFHRKSRKAVIKNAAIMGAESKNISSALWKASHEKGVAFAAASNKILKERLAAMKKTSPQAEISFTDFVEESLPLTENSPEDAFAQEDTFMETLGETENGQADEETPLSKRALALQKFSPHYKRERPKKGENSRLGTTALGTALASGFSSGQRTFGKLTKNISKKWFIGGGIVGIGILLLFVFWSGSTPLPLTTGNSESTSTEQAPQTESTSVTPPGIMKPLADAKTNTTWSEGNALLTVASGDTTVVVTPKAVILNGKSIPLPGNGSIVAATYMNDLRLVFLWSSNQELTAWSVVDQKFTPNTLPLPANTKVDALGSYLTYLYVLDKNTGSIYRFARTEGGFGEPANWLKIPFTKGSVETLVVTDTIRVSGTSTEQYFRGAKEKTLSPEGYQVLGLSNDKNFTLGVQTESGKLSVWNADGSVVFNETFTELRGVSSITYNEATKKLLVTKDRNLIEYSLSW